MEEAGFLKVIGLSYKNLFNFYGHQSRRTFVYFIVGCFIQVIFASALAVFVFHIKRFVSNPTLAILLTLLFGVILLAFSFAIILATFSSYVRRLHDMGYSGAFFPIVVAITALFVILGHGSVVLVTLGFTISGLFTLILILAQGQEEDNKYRTKDPFLVRPAFVEELFKIEEEEEN